MSTVPEWRSAEGRRFPQYTRPFLSWGEVQKLCPGHLEVQRFLRLREGIRASAWYQRRSHAPCDLEVPPDWGLDSLYFRHTCEEEYGRQLSELRENPENNLMGNHLVCFPNPWVPYCWPAPQTTCLVTYSNFPPNGDLPDPSGSGVALDSAWRLRDVSVRDGTGDPGRMIGEGKKEARDLRREGFLVPFQQVEFYQQSPETRASLYVKCPTWWGEVWVPPNMAVPLPPAITYRARMLLMEKEGTSESRFWWMVVEAEWAVLVFGRWCADVPQRGIMWRLSPRIRRTLDAMGVESLLHYCPYSTADVRSWLQAHDQHLWDDHKQTFRIRGPTRTLPAAVEERTEFVRPYNPIGPPLPPPNTNHLPLDFSHQPLSRPTFFSPMEGPASPERQEIDSDREEVIASGNFHGRGTSSTSRPVVPIASAQPPSGRPSITPATVGARNEYPMADPRPPLRSQRVPPVSHEYGTGLTVNLKELLVRSGLHDCVQFYGHHFYGTSDGVAEGPMTEELLVYALGESERKRRENQEKVRRLTIALEEAGEALRAATARAERANIIVDALAESARLHGDGGAKTSKRGRYE
jgi:hypothetical protein